MTNELEDQMISHAEIAVEKNDAKEALAAASELASIDPKDAIVWFIKGKAHYVGGQYDEALASFSQAASIQNDRPEIWLMMGYTLVALKRYSDALPSLEYVKGAEPNNVEATAALCVVHTILGHTAEAKDYLDQAVAANKSTTLAVMGHFYDKFFSTSQRTSASTKAMLERLIQSFKFKPDGAR